MRNNNRLRTSIALAAVSTALAYGGLKNQQNPHEEMVTTDGTVVTSSNPEIVEDAIDLTLAAGIAGSVVFTIAMVAGRKIGEIPPQPQTQEIGAGPDPEHNL